MRALGRFKQSAIAATMLVTLSGCDSSLEDADFNAYFYYPDDRQEFLGLVHGLSACQAAANGRADELGMSSSAGWSYICCRQTSSSSCASKHR